jgi:hypothetical protein
MVHPTPIEAIVPCCIKDVALDEEVFAPVGFRLADYAGWVGSEKKGCGMRIGLEARTRVEDRTGVLRLPGASQARNTRAYY